MALRRTLRTLAGTKRPAVNSITGRSTVNVPLHQGDLAEAVGQLQETVNELITRFNAHTHSGVTAGAANTGTTSAPVAGTVVADAALFTP